MSPPLRGLCGHLYSERGGWFNGVWHWGSSEWAPLSGGCAVTFILRGGAGLMVCGTGALSGAPSQGAVRSVTFILRGGTLRGSPVWSLIGEKYYVLMGKVNSSHTQQDSVSRWC